jgi:nucleoside 2-deoxyribosyltransferase
MIATLASYPLVYLASPYSKYDQGIVAAFQHASIVAARLMQAGVKVYSPIAHTHSLAVYGEIDPLDHSIWMPFDEAMMHACDALAVAKMPGWSDSYGISQEVAYFHRHGKPVHFLEVEHWIGRAA